MTEEEVKAGVVRVKSLASQYGIAGFVREDQYQEVVVAVLAAAEQERKKNADPD